MLRDIRYGVRALGKTPAFALGAIATVALTVGATTAIFSVVHGVLLRQLPYRDAAQVYWIWSDQPGRDRSPFNVPDFVDYRNATRTLAGFAGFFAYSANLSDESAAERVQGMRATGNFFDVVGARPRFGRLLRPDDELPGGDRVVVLTEPFWIRRFAGDPAVVGSTIRLNSEPYTVVGVMAAGFATPVRDVEFVLPFAPDRDPRRGERNSVNFIIGVGRLGDGVSATQATGELTGVAQRLQQQFPVTNARKRAVRLVAALDGIVGPFRTALLTLFASVGAVLLIACANLANLMLTRAAGRRRDIAVQLALGSSGAQVVRQVLVEALIVGVAGGAAGLVLARWGVSGLMALAPAALPRTGEVRVDATVMLFSLVVSVLTGVLFGVIPALASARVDVREALQGGSRGTTAGGQRTRGFLISAEVALAFVLLVVMTLLGKSFANVQAVSPGFDADRVLSARLTLPAKRFDTREKILVFQRALDEKLRTLPGVTHTGAITMLPLTGLMSRVPFTVEGQAIDRSRIPLAQFRSVSAGYFETARIPLTRGRVFSASDTETTRAVTIVNEELVKRWLPGVDPIGQRLLIDDNDVGPRPVEIVGVVGNVKQMTLDADPTWDLYLAYPQLHRDQVSAAAGNMFWIARTAGDPMTVAGAFAAAVRRLDPEVAASQVWPLDRYLADAMAPRRFSLSLMAAFAAAALALAVTGIYAVVLYSISLRSREIGIRLALGATRSRIVGLVMAHGLRFAALGLTGGLALAIGATRLASSLLFGVAATDGAAFGQVALVVAAASILACAVPAAGVGRLVVSALKSE